MRGVIDRLKKMAAAVYGYIVARPADTWLHIGAGLVVGWLVAWLTGGFWFGLAAGVIGGATKEVIDWCFPLDHSPELRDFLNTCIGAAIGAIAVVL